MNNKELESLLKDDLKLDEYLEKLESSNEFISINENASLFDKVLKEAEKEELKEMQKVACTKRERSKFVKIFTKTIKITFAASFAFAISWTAMHLPSEDLEKTQSVLDETYKNYSDFMLTKIDVNRLVNENENTKD